MFHILNQILQPRTDLLPAGVQLRYWGIRLIILASLQRHREFQYLTKYLFRNFFLAYHMNSWREVEIYSGGILYFFGESERVKGIFLYPTSALALLPEAKQKWSCLMKKLPFFLFIKAWTRLDPFLLCFIKTWKNLLLGKQFCWIFLAFSSLIWILFAKWTSQWKSSKSL